MRMFRLLCLSLCLLFASAPLAAAHRVNIFAYVDGGEIQVECGFNRSQKVRRGTVEVFDAATGDKLVQGTTDDGGVFRFPVTEAIRDAGHDLTVRIIAGEGHQNEWTVAAEELKAATVASGTSAPVASGAPVPASVLAVEAVSVAAVPAGTPAVSGGATPEEVERIVNAALDAKLSPIKHLLAEQVEAGPSLRDIIGGIGWIFGLVGVAAYCRRRG